MIATSRIAKGLALTVAIGLHSAALLALIAPAPTVQTEGAGGETELQIGSSFADLVEGTLSAQPPETTQPLQTRAEKAEVITPEPAKPAPPAEAATPVPVVTTSIAAQTKSEVATPSDLIAATPEQPMQFAALRPPERPKAPAPKSTPKKPIGNAAQTAKRGATTGTATTKGATRGAGKTVTKDGNAAVSNYPGQVMRCISRVGRPRVRAQGAARIAFAVSGAGAVTNVMLAQSSGVAALDKEALALISRAGPCPAPPAGAQRNFAIQIKAR